MHARMTPFDPAAARPARSQPPSTGLSAPASSLIAIVAVAVVSGLVFGLYPRLDIDIVALFYSPAQRTWPPIANRFLQLYRDSNTYITVAVAVGAALTLVAGLVHPRAHALVPPRVGLFLLATLAVGPGLITNTILKRHWGRPRPEEITQFNGTLDFVPWWSPFGACDSNCSFVSGEGSSAIWLLALAVVLPARYRAPAIAVVIVYWLTIGLTRIAMGGHFPTDILFAGVFTALTIWVLHRLILARA
jgi:membrane-associated phospholipid phosphatase